MPRAEGAGANAEMLLAEIVIMADMATTLKKFTQQAKIAKQYTN
jgi:hypothetical protein